MYNKRKFHPAKLLMMGVMFLGFFAAMSAVVMLLWNWILPEVANVKPLNFWKAAGLLLLFKILFGGMGRGKWKNRNHRRGKWKEKWMNMSDEERTEMKGKWKDWCDKKDG